MRTRPSIRLPNIPRSQLLRRSALAAVLLVGLAGSAQAAVTVFFDDFESGSVASWSVSSSAGVTAPVVALRTDSVHAGSGALWTYFDAPGGGVGANFVHATQQFTAGASGDYLLELWARSAPCSGCTMHFDVLVDGVSYARDGSEPTDYDFRSFTLSGLSAGVHTLTLGMYTDGAASGRFQASFDDVRISTEAITGAIPEPGTLLLAAAGLAGLVSQRRRR